MDSLSSCKNLLPTFSMMHLLYRLRGVDAPVNILVMAIVSTELGKRLTSLDRRKHGNILVRSVGMGRTGPL